MPFIELAGLVICSGCAVWYIGRNPSIPEYMTREADEPVRARVKMMRNQGEAGRILT